MGTSWKRSLEFKNEVLHKTEIILGLKEDLLLVDTERRKRNREEGDSNCLGPQRAMNSHILLLSGILPLVPIGSFAYA